MTRLQTDQSLAKFANQFVVLKAEPDDPDGARFSVHYATEKNSVPRICIIASDGTAIVKQVGAPQGDSLPEMLSGALQQSGPMLPAPRARAVEEAVKSIAVVDLEAEWMRVANLLLEIEADLAAGNLVREPLAQATRMLETVDAAMTRNLEQARSKLDEAADDFEALECGPRWRCSNRHP